jgi:predicted site-specific integrase-resolvase
MGYVSLSGARNHFGVSGKTLYRWEASGKVAVKRSPGNRRLFLIDDSEPQLEPRRESVVYVRVSSSKQQDDAMRSIYLTNTPNPELSGTSARASTSRGRDFYLF